MISAFSHIYMPCRDVQESIDFYTGLMGFELFRSWEMNGRRSAYCKLNGVLLELTLRDNTPIATDNRVEPRIGLIVDDIAAEIARLRAAGVTVEREPWAAATFWGTQAMIRDPNGWVISLREYRAPDSPDFKDWTPDQPGVVRLQ
jgi:catechol 2,3-dioxygenase-like lactoylglutathione lyase family enzyme